MFESQIRRIKGLHGFLEVKRIKICEISVIRLIRVQNLIDIQNYLKLKKLTCVNLNTMFESRIKRIARIFNVY